MRKPGRPGSSFSSRGLLSCRLRIKADHPLNAELICEHSEIGTPESFVHRHRHFSSGRKAVEKFIGFRLCVGTDGNGKVISLYSRLATRLELSLPIRMVSLLIGRDTCMVLFASSAGE